MSPTDRQKQRDEASIEAEIVNLNERRLLRNSEINKRHGPGTAERIARQSHASRSRIYAKRPKATHEQTAVVARYFEAIKDPRQVDTPDKPATAITHRAVALTDVMHKEGNLPMHLQHSAVRFRELFFVSMGWSQGVANYGDFVESSDPTKRCPTNDQQMHAYENLKKAALAAFGIIDIDGRWRLDEQLMQQVVPSILSDRKTVTQGSIGRARSGYKGRAQVNAAGGQIIREVLHRLALHFVYTER